MIEQKQLEFRSGDENQAIQREAVSQLTKFQGEDGAQQYNQAYMKIKI